MGVRGQDRERYDLWRATQTCPSLVPEVLAPRGQELGLPQVPCSERVETETSPGSSLGPGPAGQSFLHKIGLTCF